MATAPLSRFFIVGPTASGKSDLAVAIALRCNAEIVGADAFQVYAGLDLLTAKPSKTLLASAPHHLVGEIPLHQTYDVARYLQHASQRIAEIHSRGNPALIVGGTGLYVRALTHGLADLPPADPALRQELQALPLDILQNRLLSLDPLAHSRIDLKNPRRLVRALEVCLLTKRPFSSFQTQWQTPPADAPGVFLNPPRLILHQRIENRTEQMFTQGVVEEVANVAPLSATASQTLGLNLIQDLIAGNRSRYSCIDALTIATRQYAKRQITWFARDSTFQQCASTDSASLEALADRCSREILAR